MEAWIIDDRPLDWLARFVDPAELTKWPRGQFSVAEATKTAAQKDAATSYSASKRLALLDAPDPAIEAFSIQFGTEAFSLLYTHLAQPAGTNTDLAENQSIAWALAEQRNAVLVTVDKRASVLALAELGRYRVAHAFDLWLKLRESRLLSENQFKALCMATLKSDQSLNNMPLRCQR
jgi:hypothetical protein